MPWNQAQHNARERERAALRRLKYHPRGPCEFCGPDCNCKSCGKMVIIETPSGPVQFRGDFVWDHRDKTTKRRSIARMLGGYSDQAIEAELRKCRILCRSCNSSGERNGVVTMTPDKVREIRRRGLKGDTHESLARLYGCSPRLVGMIIAGQVWTEKALQNAERGELDDRIY